MRMMALTQQKRDQKGSSLMLGITGGGVSAGNRPGRGLQNPAVRTHLPCAQTHSLNKKAECEMNWQGSSTVIVSNGNGKYHGTLLYIYILRVLNDCMFINYEIYMVF